MDKEVLEPDRLKKIMLVLPTSMVVELDALATSQDLTHGRSHLVRQAIKRFLREEQPREVQR